MKRLTTLLLGVMLGALSLQASNGATLYKKCIACHGAKAEKKALNRSQVIAGWKSDKTVAALKGYKTGTYGGVMKGLMKGQVANFNDSQLKALGDYIESLK